MGWVRFGGGLLVWCAAPLGSCSPVCTLRVWCRLYRVLGFPAPVHRCARPACGVACTASWASRLLFTGVHALRVVSRVRRPGPPGPCSPVRTLCVWRCVYGVLGLPAPVHRRARSACGVACTASWASRLLLTGVHAPRVASRVRRPGPPGPCSPVRTLCVWRCVYGVLGLPAPVHRCARPACGVVCTVSWASRLLFTGVHALRVVSRVRRPGPPGSCSPVCTPCVWCRVYGVLGRLAPVHRCARSACGVACTASWASRLLFTGVHALRVVLRVRRPGPPGSCSPVCTPCVWCRVYGVLGLPAPAHRCARSACGVACTASWASRLPFTGVHALRVVSCVRCPGPPGSCSPVCTPNQWGRGGAPGAANLQVRRTKWAERRQGHNHNTTQQQKKHHSTRQRTMVPHTTKHGTKQHGAAEDRATPTETARPTPTRDGQRQSQQHNSRAPRSRTPRAAQNSPHPTAAPHNKTRGTAHHKAQPGGGEGGHGTSGQSTERAKGREPRGEKDTQPKRSQGQRHGKNKAAAGGHRKTSSRAATPAKHKPGQGGGTGTTEGTDKRPVGAEQPQGTEATRVNAKQDATSRKMLPAGGRWGRGTTAGGRGTPRSKGQGRRQKAEVGWAGVGGRSSTRRQTPAHGQELRRHEKVEGEQGNTSSRATTPAKRKHGVAHRTSSGGRPVRPGQDKGVAHHTRSGGRPVRPGQANTTDNQHPTTPVVQRRRQQRTNKASRASSRLQHHEPKPEHADTARPTKGGATHKHGTCQQGGGATPAQHQPRPSKHHRQPTPDNAGRTAAETTANQQNKPSIQPATTPQTETRTRRQSTPDQGGGASTNTARSNRGGGGGHAPAQHQTLPSEPHNRNRNPPNRRRQPKPNTTTAAGRHQQNAPRRGGPYSSTARPTKRWTTQQHSTPH